jgi:hypothetical protein
MIVAAALASPVAAIANGGAYLGKPYGQVPGAQAGVLEQVSNGAIAVKVVNSKTVEVLIFVAFGCDYPNASQGGFITNPEMSILQIPLSPSGHFSKSGTFNQKTIITAGTPGGTLTISGQISGKQASGTFSLTAHKQGPDACKGYSGSWKATYSPNASPDLP